MQQSSGAGQGGEMATKRTKTKVWLSLVIFFIVCAVAVISVIITDGKSIIGIQLTSDTPTATATVTATMTLTPTKTPLPTATSTVTPTPTQVPVMQMMIEEAKTHKAFLVILFTPNTAVPDYFNAVWEYQGLTPEDVLGEMLPEILEQIKSESIYPYTEYFKVYLVSDFVCDVPQYCVNPPVYYYNDIFHGVGLGHLHNELKYGDYAIHWQPADNRFCIVGTISNFCSPRR